LSFFVNSLQGCVSYELFEAFEEGAPKVVILRRMDFKAASFSTPKELFEKRALRDPT
jgi:hypothetical protein